MSGQSHGLPSENTGKECAEDGFGGRGDSLFILNINRGEAEKRVPSFLSGDTHEHSVNSTSGDICAEDNLGLVHSIAHRFVGRGIEYEELFSAGCLGLAKAVKRFDSSRGLCFSTYAFPLIMGEIRGLFRQSGTVKVSRTLKELAVKAARLSEEYESTHGAPPTVAQLAETLGVSTELTAQALCASSRPLSLTADEDEDGGGVRDIPVDSGEEKLAEILSLREELSRLRDDDRSLITLRYYRGMTQTQTAKALGATQVQISRREKKILGSLREKLA